MTPTTITVTVIADTGSPLRPGLFQGSVDAVKAWAKYINANGGLACRQVVVKTADSKLTENDAENAITTACGELARDGRHDRAVPRQHEAGRAVQGQGRASRPASPTSRCSRRTPPSSARRSRSRRCRPARRVPYSGSGVRTFKELERPRSTTTSRSTARTRCTACTSCPSDLPVDDLGDRRRCSRPTQQLGIKEDAEFGVSALAPQSGYTPYVAGDQDPQVDVRPRRLRLREQRVLPQGSAGAGREHGEGVGLLAAVLRPALHLDRRFGGREPVHVVVVPAVRGQGPQRRSSTTSSSTTPRPTRSARRPGSPVRCSPPR